MSWMSFNAPDDPWYSSMSWMSTNAQVDPQCSWMSWMSTDVHDDPGCIPMLKLTLGAAGCLGCLLMLKMTLDVAGCHGCLFMHLDVPWWTWLQLDVAGCTLMYLVAAWCLCFKLGVNLGPQCTWMVFDTNFLICHEKNYPFLTAWNPFWIDNLVAIVIPLSTYLA